ncbi:MAG: DNA polymerase II [Kangiellaceae bacterium]|nr:DNA polymerase II [Kangiellaceae bacterium]
MTASPLTENQGFLITRQSYDRDGTTRICLWVATKSGPVKLLIDDERPILFINRSDLDVISQRLKRFHSDYSQRPLDLKTFEHQAINGLYFKSLNRFYEARKVLESGGYEFFEGGIRLEERFLMERFVYGGLEFIGDKRLDSTDSNNQYTEYHHVKIKPANYTPSLKRLSLDLECSEFGELYSIGFHCPWDSSLNRVVMIDERLSRSEDIDDREVVGGNEKKSLFELYRVKDETALLQALERVIQETDPDVIVGWNVINFDFKLIYKRAAKHNLTLKLGRGNSAMRWRDSRSDKNQGFVTIDGRVVIDGIAAMKAEAYSFPSFSLESIAQHFLGKGKQTQNVEQRLATINHDFKFNKVKLAEYNFQDCVLVSEIFEKIQLLEYLVFRGQLTGLELDRAGGSVAAFINLYLPKLHRSGYVSPNLPAGGGLASPGGYVMNSKPGLYQNVLVLDFKSLYPSIIRTFKIDPLGLVEGLKSPDEAIEGFREAVFSRDKHLLPEIITDLWQQRDQAKKDKDQARSQAIKIIMNSFYGVLGSGGCPFYDTRLASSITLRGHEIMQQTAEWIEQKGLEVIYGDTDSTFVLLGDDYDQQQANELGESLAEFINANWQAKLATEFQIECHLEIEFETHFSRFLMPTIRGSEHGSKKRYAGLLKSDRGEELVFKGLENVRTDWTRLAKDFQEALYRMVFNQQDPKALIVKTVEQTLAGERDNELIFRKRLRRNLQSYVKNVPPHVKAARLADEKNSQLGKPLQYQNKGTIEYIMTLQGPQPIEYISASIDYQFYVDRQIEPVADGILPFIGLAFKEVVEAQMGLF